MRALGAYLAVCVMCVVYNGSLVIASNLELFPNVGIADKRNDVLAKLNTFHSCSLNVLR